MDAVKFVKEYLRMCTKVDECEDCPVYKTDFCTVPAKERSQESAEEIVELVEEWSAAHPRKTRQDVFLEQYPDARIDKTTGVLTICPAELTKECRDDRGACGAYSIEPCVCGPCRREFWTKVVG